MKLNKHEIVIKHTHTHTHTLKNSNIYNSVKVSEKLEWVMEFQGVVNKNYEKTLHLLITNITVIV